MKVYKFDCESCGSKQYIKTKSGYKCKYCGSIQDVISMSDESKQDSASEQSSSASAGLQTDRAYSAHFRHESKRSLILLLVCVFAGIYGVHRFMQRKILSGLLFLFTGGLFGIGWFIDVVKLGIKCAVEWKESGGV